MRSARVPRARKRTKQGDSTNFADRQGCVFASVLDFVWRSESPTPLERQGGFIHQEKNLLVHFSELSLLARNLFQGG